MEHPNCPEKCNHPCCMGCKHSSKSYPTCCTHPQAYLLFMLYNPKATQREVAIVTWYDEPEWCPMTTQFKLRPSPAFNEVWQKLAILINLNLDKKVEKMSCLEKFLFKKFYEALAFSHPVEFNPWANYYEQTYLLLKKIPNSVDNS